MNSRLTSRPQAAIFEVEKEKWGSDQFSHEIREGKTRNPPFLDTEVVVRVPSICSISSRQYPTFPL